MSTALLNLDGIIDLNSIFTLNYNFDYLKMILEALIHANKATNEKMKEFQVSLNEKDNKIQELENKLNTINNTLIIKRKKDKNENDESNQDEDIKVNSIYNSSQDFEEIKIKLKKHEENIIINNSSIEEIFEKLRNLTKQGDKHENDIYNITVKLNELYQSCKNLGKKNNQAGVDDELLILLNSLENKINLKFEKQDEINEELSNEFKILKGEYDNLRPTIEKNTKNISHINEQVEIIFARLNDLKALIASNHAELNDKISKLREFVNSQIEEITNLIEHLRETFYNDGNNQLSENDNKLLKDLLKRISDLEKGFKNFSANINIEAIMRELDKINASLNSKAALADFDELKSSHESLVVEVKNLKIALENLISNRSLEDDIILLKKKIDTINAHLHSMRNSTDDSKSQVKNLGSFEFNKFVEIQTFLEFKNHTTNEIKALHDRIDELRRLLDDLINLLGEKADIVDFKKFEELVMLKLEELKNACNKKFADKNETAKNFKYLDSQIKQIIELYIKNKDKADNWLLAKKPFGGNSCASCEAYIGELHDNSQPIHWNKYPMRDPSDKLYRVGSGFSKMLQMLNFDNQNPNTSNSPHNMNINYRDKPPQTANNFYRPHNPINSNNPNPNNNQNIEIEKNFEKMQLPRLNRIHMKKGNLNMSSDNMEVEENFDNMDDGMQPKVVKIYRKIKDKKE